MSKKYQGNQGGKKYVPAVQPIEKLVTVYDGELVSPEKQVLIDFENSKTIIDGKEMYNARKLLIAGGQRPDRYKDSKVYITNAIKACKKADNSLQATDDDRFLKFQEPFPGGNGAIQNRENYWLTPYACRMVIQEMPSRHVNIAILRDYFARVVGEHIDMHKWHRGIEPNRAKQRISHTESHNAYGKKAMEHGFSTFGVAQLTSDADKAFYNHPTSEVKEIKNIPKNVPLANHENATVLSLKSSGKLMVVELMDTGALKTKDNIATVNSKIFSDLQNVYVSNVGQATIDIPMHADSLGPAPVIDRELIKGQLDARLETDIDKIDFEAIDGSDVDGLIELDDGKIVEDVIEYDENDQTEYLPDDGVDRSFCIYDTELKAAYVGKHTRATAAELSKRGIDMPNGLIGNMITSGKYMNGKYLFFFLTDRSPELTELMSKYNISYVVKKPPGNI